MSGETTTGRVPAGETAVFCTQAALLLEAGIPLGEGLATLVGEGTPAGRGPLARVADTVQETGSLYEGVRAAGVFPAYMVQMIRIGEAAGKLEEVLRSLGRYYEREETLSRSVRSAVLYPVILILLMAAVVAVLVIAVLPVFSQVFAGLGADLSTAGASWMEAGVWIGRIALIAVAVLLVCLAVLFILSLTAPGRAWLLRLGARLPGLRGTSRQIAASRFASVMAMLLSSGYDLNEALEMAAAIVPDAHLKAQIGQCRERVAQGDSLAAALQEGALFSGLYARLLQTGEQAGRLDEVMERLAVHYEEEADQSLGRLVSVIEPALVIVLSVIIGAILLSVMLPLISILSLIG